MHEVLVNRLGGLSLPRKSVVRLTDRPDMTLDVYRGRKTTMQQQQQQCIVGYSPGSRAKHIYAPGSDKLTEVHLYMSTSCQPGSRVIRAFSYFAKPFFIFSD